MRFGKTFATYQLAKRMGWKKVLVLTFKPAVVHAWSEDLTRHIDFEGWQFITRRKLTYEQANKKKPIICFGSFQDFLQLAAGGDQAAERVGARDQMGLRDSGRIPLRRMAGERQGTVWGGRQRRSGRGSDQIEASLTSRSCRSRRGTTCICRARPSGRWHRASSSKSRFTTGPTVTNSGPSETGRDRGRTRMWRCRDWS